ncbi:MAG: protein kinase [Ruminiclostridium sp.]|nr:protein kinase [Ruminiclostridium sp.]
MNINEIFNEKYSSSHTLPDKITLKYNIVSCLKYTEERHVYLITEKETGRKLILKCGTGKSGELLLREYNIISELMANGAECNMLLLPVEYFCIENTHYYIREYAEGKTLASRVEKGVNFNEKDSFDIIAQLCKEIHVLHTQNPPVICRDINPRNVLICNDGSLKIIDFDSARHFNKTATSDTNCVGTKEMAAPEQFGYTQTNVRTDIYVLGMLLLYISTGTYDRYTEMPDKLKKIVAKSTAFNPEDRYPSALRMYKALISKPKKKAFVSVIAVIMVALTVIGAVIFTNKSNFSPVSFINSSLFRKEAVFTSSEIEQAVRLQLEKTEDEPLYMDEVAEVDTLIISGFRIFSSWDALDTLHNDGIESYGAMLRDESPLPLSDLKMLTGLKYLALEKKGLTEMPDLSGLELKKLSLMDNELVYVDGIEQCEKLETVLLSGNYNLCDITPLEQLPLLTELNLSCCVSLQSVDPVVNLPLEHLYMNYTDVKHVENIDRLDKLKVLRFANLDRETIEKLPGIKTIEELDIAECDALTGMSDFVGLDNLETIFIGDCKNFTSLDSISKLEKLRFITIHNTPLAEIPEEIAETRLENINLSNNKITDYTPLGKISGGSTLYLDDEAQGIAAEQLADANISINP